MTIIKEHINRSHIILKTFIEYFSIFPFSYVFFLCPKNVSVLLSNNFVLVFFICQFMALIRFHPNVVAFSRCASYKINAKNDKKIRIKKMILYSTNALPIFVFVTLN